MHTFHDNWFPMSDLGAGDRLAWMSGVGPAGNHSAGSRYVGSADRLERTENAKKIREAAADGKITQQEKSAFSGADAQGVITGEVSRLADALKGKYELNGYIMSDHGKFVTKLRDEKAKKHDLDSMLTTRDTFAPGSDGRRVLEDKIRARKQDEDSIVKVVKDKTQLIGTLEGEKMNLEAQKPQIARNDYQALREKAQPFLDVFNKYDGQDYSPDTFGDDWDSVKGDYSFDSMVKQFQGKPGKVDDWAKHQDNAESKAAVSELAKIMREYESAATTVNTSEARILEISNQQTQLHDEIANDRSALSDSTLKQLDKDLATSTPSQKPAQPQQDMPGDSGSGTAPLPAKPQPKQDMPGDSGSGTAPLPAKTSVDVIRDHGGKGPKYTVQRGDSLAKIAQEYNEAYNTNISWHDIYESNKGIVGEPYVSNGQTYAMIHPNQVLSIPSIAELINSELEPSADDRSGDPR